MQNTAAKKGGHQEDVDSDYLFGNVLQLPAFRSSHRPRSPSSFSSELPDSSDRGVFRGNNCTVPSSQLRPRTTMKLEAGRVKISGPVSAPFS